MGLRVVVLVVFNTFDLITKDLDFKSFFSVQDFLLLFLRLKLHFTVESLQDLVLLLAVLQEQDSLYISITS